MSLPPDKQGSGRPPGRPRCEKLSAKRVREIIKAGSQVFAEHGYDKTDMQSIADRAGVSKGTIYLYFQNKEELFFQCVRAGVDQLMAYIDEAIDVVPDFIDRLPLAIRAYLRYFDEHPELVELIIQERAKFRDRKQSTYFEHKATHARNFTEDVRTGIRAGRLRDLPVERVVDVISDLLYGTMFANHFRGRLKALEEQAEDILDIVRHGIINPDRS